MSRWLVGIKRLVQEVESVEAPLSPSYDCHSDIRLSSLCDVQPSPATTDCLSLTAGATETDVANAGGKDSSSLQTTVADSECAVASLADCVLMSESIVSHLNIEDTDAATSSSDTLSSHDARDDVQVAHISTDFTTS